MAEVVCIKKERKARSENFILTVTEIIKNQVRLNPILEAKHSNTVQRMLKSNIFGGTSQIKLMLLGYQKGLSKKSKISGGTCVERLSSSFTEHRRQSQKTGGGPPPTPLSPNLVDVVRVDMYRDSSAFSGIQVGMETSTYF